MRRAAAAFMPPLSLNANTLLFSASLLGFLAAALTWSLARSNGAVRRAAIAWSSSMLCGGLALFAFFLDRRVPDYVPLVLGNALIMAFGLLALLAYARLFSLRYADRAIAVVYVVQLVAIVAFQLAGIPREYAVLYLCSFLTIELAWAAAIIVRYGGEVSAPVRRVATATMSVFAALFATRIVATLLGYSPDIDASAQSRIQIATLLGASIVIIGSTIAFVLMVQDHRHREMLESARRDALTGVLTRKAFFDELAELEVGPEREFALVMLDIDHFKQINDRHGHLGGDAALAYVGALLRRTTRASDVTGRYGGEEFCVLMRDCGEDEAGQFARRLVEIVAAARVTMPDGQKAALTASAGYAGGRSAGAGAARTPVVRDVMAKADSALYEAKRAGRNRVMAADDARVVASSQLATLSEGLLSV